MVLCKEINEMYDIFATENHRCAIISELLGSGEWIYIGLDDDLRNFL